jgi:hypothetical protein
MHIRQTVEGARLDDVGVTLLQDRRILEEEVVGEFHGQRNKLSIALFVDHEFKQDGDVLSFNNHQLENLDEDLDIDQSEESGENARTPDVSAETTKKKHRRGSMALSVDWTSPVFQPDQADLHIWHYIRDVPRFKWTVDSLKDGQMRLADVSR